jgi:hypothetical protein
MSGWAHALVGAALRAPRAVHLALAALALYALLVALPRLPVEQYPDLAQGELWVSTAIPGLDAAACERAVTAPIEAALRDLPGLDRLTSWSEPGQSWRCAMGSIRERRMTRCACAWMAWPSGCPWSMAGRRDRWRSSAAPVIGCPCCGWG